MDLVLLLFGPKLKFWKVGGTTVDKKFLLSSKLILPLEGKLLDDSTNIKIFQSGPQRRMDQLCLKLLQKYQGGWIITLKL